MICCDLPGAEHAAGPGASTTALLSRRARRVMCCFSSRHIKILVVVETLTGTAGQVRHEGTDGGKNRPTPFCCCVTTVTPVCGNAGVVEGRLCGCCHGDGEARGVVTGGTGARVSDAPPPLHLIWLDYAGVIRWGILWVT